MKLKYSKKAQLKAIKELCVKLGVDFERIGLDQTIHGFTTTIGNDDVRITANYESFIKLFFTVVHEAGHALYNLGYQEVYKDTVISNPASVGLHESQSKFWENMICKSAVFWRAYFKIFKR